jgi:MFS transporter, SHS family, lactate transporter
MHMSRGRSHGVEQRAVFVAAQLGWVMDAFDYFVVVFVYADVARTFHVARADVAFLTTASLALRPLGALVFGAWADRVGPRVPLIADGVFYSTVGFCCAFAPDFAVLLVLRLLYSIGIGGDWGLGTALVMERIAPVRRGLLSSLLQNGYCYGYLLAALSSLALVNVCGLSWRWLFGLTAVPGLITLVVRWRLPDSGEQLPTRPRLTRGFARAALAESGFVRRFAYLVLLMVVFHWMSLATQDMYPTFLSAHGDGGAGLSTATAKWIAVVYNLGAILGGLSLGGMARRLDRRHTIAGCAALALATVPMYAYSHAAAGLCLASFGMQFAVQGAWTAIPAHLSELAPTALNACYPGVVYQLGMVLAAFNLPLQQHLASDHGYRLSLTVTVVPVLIAVATLTLLGRAVKPAAEPACTAEPGVAALEPS